MVTIYIRLKSQRFFYTDVDTDNSLSLEGSKNQLLGQ